MKSSGTRNVWVGRTEIKNPYFNPVKKNDNKETTCGISYPAGNTSRHMGQLCSVPPPAASPPLLCTSSSSSTNFSLFLPFFSRQICLSVSFSFLSSSRPTLVDDATASQLLWEGCGLLVKAWRDVVLSLRLCHVWEGSGLSGGSGATLVCIEGSCWDKQSLSGPGLDAVLWRGKAGSGKEATSSRRSHHRWSSNFGDVGLYNNMQEKNKSRPFYMPKRERIVFFSLKRSDWSCDIAINKSSKNTNTEMKTVEGYYVLGFIALLILVCINPRVETKTPVTAQSKM